MVTVLPDIRIIPTEVFPRRVAELTAAQVAEVMVRRGRCRVGLPGGRTPRAVYEALATLPVRWDTVELFWTDERCVPPDDDASNYNMVNLALLSRIDVPARNVHRIEGEHPPATAASRYAVQLGGESLDILLLGMGLDGHTASLFPGDVEPAATERVIATRSPVPPTDRVSLSMRTINEAAAVVVVVDGAGKAARLAEVESQLHEGRLTDPVACVQPSSGRLMWLVDTAAGSRLRKQHG